MSPVPHAMPLKETLEAILFIAPRPLSVRRLASLLEAEEAAVQEALATLAAEYRARNGGVTVIDHEGEAQMVTASAASEVVQKFLKDETTGELTKPALETLTIIAYRGPLTRADLERIRGVNCSIILRNLMVRGLVRAEEDKRQLVTYYTVAVEFLKFLGLQSIRDLPEYDALHRAEAVGRFLAEEGSAAPDA